MSLAYVLNPLDRRANDRPNAEWVLQQRRRADAKLIRIAGDAALLQGGRLVTDNDATAESAVFLGLDAQDVPWFAFRTEAADGMRDLRSLAMEEALPAAELGMLAQARSLLQWHERRTYCSNCAARLEVADAGYRRHCPGCGMDHFPRTDPVAIMVVRHQGSILLGRQSSWKPGMYSALAGFVEPGETIEDAARREVFEESGVRVGAVRRSLVDAEDAQIAGEELELFHRQPDVPLRGVALDVGIELRGRELSLDLVGFELGHVDAIRREAAHRLVEGGRNVPYTEDEGCHHRHVLGLGVLGGGREHHEARGVVALVLDVLADHLEAIDFGGELRCDGGLRRITRFRKLACRTRRVGGDDGLEA